MAHFARIDAATNIVLNVVVIDNDEIADARFASGESEQKGIDRCVELFGDDPAVIWRQTSYCSHGGSHHTQDSENRFLPDSEPHFRYNMAGIGFVWHEAEQAFSPAPPANHETEPWTLDTNTYTWSWTGPGYPGDALEQTEPWYEWDSDTDAWVVTNDNPFLKEENQPS